MDKQVIAKRREIERLQEEVKAKRKALMVAEAELHDSCQEMAYLACPYRVGDVLVVKHDKRQHRGWIRGVSAPRCYTSYTFMLDLCKIKKDGKPGLSASGLYVVGGDDGSIAGGHLQIEVVGHLEPSERP